MRYFHCDPEKKENWKEEEELEKGVSKSRTEDSKTDCKQEMIN